MDQNFADKMVKKATDLLAPLEQEMTIMKWPAEFRKILWRTVSVIAAERAARIKVEPPN